MYQGVHYNYAAQGSVYLVHIYMDPATYKPCYKGVCASQRTCIPPSPRAVPQQPCCQYMTFLQMAAVRTWTQACMAKGLVSLQPNS